MPFLWVSVREVITNRRSSFTFTSELIIQSTSNNWRQLQSCRESTGHPALSLVNCQTSHTLLRRQWRSNVVKPFPFPWLEIVVLWGDSTPRTMHCITVHENATSKAFRRPTDNINNNS